MTEQILSTVKRRLNEARLPEKGKSALIALSGGADSVALLHILLRLGYRCHAAHCNFHLRGDESDRDERFVTTLCAELNVPLSVTHFDVADYRSSHSGTSLEMACRELRYPWFESERERLGLDFIAVAHHAGDNVETFLLNATRGTGLAGLKAMRTVAGRIVRPLLSLTRDDITAFLTNEGIGWVNDCTNAQDIYRRNALRLNVIPDLNNAIPNASDGITTTIQNLTADYDLMQEMLDHARQQILNGNTINTTQLLEYDNCETLLFHLLLPYGFNSSQCRDLITALTTSSCGSRSFYSSTHVVHVDSRGTATLKAISSYDPEESHNFILEKLQESSLPISITAKLITDTPFAPSMTDGHHTIALPHRFAQEMLTLRHPRLGDRIEPFGMHGSRLLSDLFNDRHLSTDDKRRQWVLTDPEGRILWALGHRASRHTAVLKNEPFWILSINQ